jgi:hypothetical protein
MMLVKEIMNGNTCHVIDNRVNISQADMSCRVQ